MVQITNYNIVIGDSAWTGTNVLGNIYERQIYNYYITEKHAPTLRAYNL